MSAGAFNSSARCRMGILMKASGTIFAHEPCGLELTARVEAAFGAGEISVFGDEFRVVA